MKSTITLLLLLLSGFISINFMNDKGKDSRLLVQNNCITYIGNDTIIGKLIGLNYNKFDTIEIKKLFNNPVKVEIISKEENSATMTFKFKSLHSQLTIFTNGYLKDCYLDVGEITDNSIKLNYKIEIGMSKETFFKKFSIPISDCDSLRVDEIGSGCLFVFKNMKLSKIVFTTTI
jgi:hypothetical protein